MGIMSDLIEKHKAVRRLTLVWAIVIITWVTARVFEDLSKINGDVVGAYAIVTGLLATVIGFYKWTRHKDDSK